MRPKSIVIILTTNSSKEIPKSVNNNTPPQTAIVWFRKDLRIHDNPAFFYAMQNFEKVIPIFIHSPSEEEPWAPGAASNWWLHHSLSHLQNILKTQYHLDLQYFSDPCSQDILEKIQAETQASALFWNRRYEPQIILRDQKIKAFFAEKIEVKSFSSWLLLEPEFFKNRENKPYLVFTPFYKSAIQSVKRVDILDAPAAENKESIAISFAEELKNLNLLPQIPWDKKFYETHQVGEDHTRKNLTDWCEKHIQNYLKNRDFPALNQATTALSAPLAFGEISIREALFFLEKLPESEGRDGLIRQLFWREFAWHLLYHFPETTHEPLRPYWKTFPWNNDPKNPEFLSWTRGQTGFALVDAGMQELWQTGLMHNRVRMLVASVLVKHDLVHWQQGTKWFWDTLVDADLANNTLGWQWVAGCGADAAPYFRIFNPHTQIEKFDPNLHYCRKWNPRVCPEKITHEEGRKRALDAYQNWKKAQSI